MSSFNYEKALSIEWNGQMFVLTVRKETSMNADYLYSYNGTDWKTMLDLSNSSLLTHKNPYNIKWTGTQYSMIGDLTNSEGEHTLLKSKHGEHFSNISTNLNTPLYDLETNLEFPHTILFPKNITLALGGSPSDTTKIAYSLDEGITWTPSLHSSLIFTETANNAYWNGKIWVAVGKGTNTIATSLDGISWTGRGSYLFTDTGYSVFWNKEKSIWLASGKGTHSIAYSYDGVYWTGIGNTLLSEAYDIKWNGKIWIATGVPTTGKKSIIYSYDGIYWNMPLQNNLFDIQGLKINWNGIFWTVLGNSSANNGSYNIATSNDGIIWNMKNNTFLTDLDTTHTNLFSYLNNTIIINGNNSISLTITHNYSQLLTTPITDIESVRAILYNGTYYLLGGNAILYSTDSVHWSSSPTSISNMSIIKNFAWNHPYLGTPQIKPLSIALGEGNNTIAYSEDGIYWKGLGKDIFTERGNHAIWNGTIWVAVGKGLFWVASSYDGLNWLGRNNSLMEECYDVAWNGTVFIAVGYGTHNMTVSSDGIHWYGIPNANTLFSVRANAIIWTGKIWLAYGSGNNTTAYSDSLDGWIWNPTSQKNQVITNATSIFENTNYSHPNDLFSASSYSDSFYPYNAFNNTMDLSGSTDWLSANNTYDNITGNNINSTITTYDEVLSASGEWLQVNTNNSCVIKYYSISCYIDVSNSYYTIPKEWYVLGSEDGEQWNKIDYFKYNTSSPPISKNFPFFIKIQNIYSNIHSYRYYRFIFPSIFSGGSPSFVKISEIDLFCENNDSNTINERIRPIVTKQHILFQTNIYSLSKQKKTVYCFADLYGNTVDTILSEGIHYNTTILSDKFEENTSFCFDGENLITTQKGGHIKYINNVALNTVSIFDISSSSITQNIPQHIYSSCFNGQRILVGGTTGNILSYSSPFYKNPSFYNIINTNSLFTTVYGLASNPGYGFLYTPNRIYFSPGEKVSIIGPKAYNKNISNSNTIQMSLYNTEIVKNITLPSTTVIFGLLGPTGPRGAGDMGQIGPIGVLGPVGPTGYYGGSPYGDTGEDGVKGPTGNTGESGFIGNTGEPGKKGSMGNTGPVGPTGNKGHTGEEGPTGPIGLQLWTVDTSANISTYSQLLIGDIMDSSYILDVSGELYHKGNMKARHANIISDLKIVHSFTNTNSFTNIIELSGQVLTNHLLINKNRTNEENLSLDISGTLRIKQFNVNQLYKSIRSPIVVNNTHISIDYNDGDRFYFNIENTINEHFYCIVENLPFSKFSNSTFCIDFIIDYKDALLTSRYYCKNLIINNQTYNIYFNDGEPSSPNFYTSNYIIQKIIILFFNSSIQKVVCDVKNY